MLKFFVFIYLLYIWDIIHINVISTFIFLMGPWSRPPKKDFVEVTELTDITYTSNLVKLRPGHINVVLVLTNASKTALLRKFAKEVFSFSGQVFIIICFYYFSLKN